MRFTLEDENSVNFCAEGRRLMIPVPKLLFCLS